MKKALIVYDQEGWVFERMADALMKYCRNWHIAKISAEDLIENPIKTVPYDVILWLPDYLINSAKKAGIDPKELIIAIRCDVFKKGKDIAGFYSNGSNLRRSCAGIACANLSLKKRFDRLHPNVYHAPGGVDTEVFRPVNMSYNRSPWHDPPIAGWAGSASNFGPELRGLDLIEKSCVSLKIGFKPCLRESRWRTQEEMVKYYQDEIDIYIDAHEHAGRQNGLLEAGACGKMLVATRAGISEELILSGQNGFLCNRSEEGIKGALYQAMTSDRQKMALAIRGDIERKWSWAMHARQLEEIFDDVKQ